VSQMVVRVNGHIMDDTGTGLRSEALQSETDNVTTWRAWF
jgi:hypothetical protein